MAFFLRMWRNLLHLSPWHSKKVASFLGIMEENVGTILLIQTVEGVYYGKIERVWKEEVLIGIGDRIAILDVKDIINIVAK
jgi:hypothetical protein